MNTRHFSENLHVSFCCIYIVVSENQSGQNSGGGGTVYSHPKVKKQNIADDGASSKHLSVTYNLFKKNMIFFSKITNKA